MVPFEPFQACIKRKISTVGALHSPYDTKTDALFRAESTTYYFKRALHLRSAWISITYFVVDLPSIFCPIELKLTHETFYKPQQAWEINMGSDAFCKRHKCFIL